MLVGQIDDSRLDELKLVNITLIIVALKYPPE